MILRAMPAVASAAGRATLDRSKVMARQKEITWSSRLGVGREADNLTL